MTTEIWKDVAGWEGRYMVSDQGRLSRIMKLSPHRDGYLKINLCHNSVSKTVHIHQIVAAAFLGPRPEGSQVNHINGGKTDNQVNNLEYTTVQRNAIHASELNLRPVGEAINTAKLTTEDVKTIRQMYRPVACSYSKLASIYGVSKGTIANIVLGKTWKHIDITDPQALQEVCQLNEEWRPVVGWEHLYIVSNHGRVASLANPKPARDGYVKIDLTLDDFRQSTCIHRLVAQAFLSDYVEEFQVNHIDGNKANNRLSNLECLPIDKHYRRTVERLGYYPGSAGTKGEANNSSKLTEDKVRRIRSLYAAGQHSYQRIADRYGVTKQAIWHIVQRKTWEHVD